MKWTSLIAAAAIMVTANVNANETLAYNQASVLPQHGVVHGGPAVGHVNGAGSHHYQQASWQNGCCERPNDCCRGLWDNYCAERTPCRQASCGTSCGYGCDSACGAPCAPRGWCTSPFFSCGSGCGCDTGCGCSHIGWSGGGCCGHRPLLGAFDNCCNSILAGCDGFLSGCGNALARCGSACNSCCTPRVRSCDPCCTPRMRVRAPVCLPSCNPCGGGFFGAGLFGGGWRSNCGGPSWIGCGSSCDTGCDSGCTSGCDSHGTSYPTHAAPSYPTQAAPSYEVAPQQAVPAPAHQAQPVPAQPTNTPINTWDKSAGWKNYRTPNFARNVRYSY